VGVWSGEEEVRHMVINGAPGHGIAYHGINSYHHAIGGVPGLIGVVVIVVLIAIAIVRKRSG
jgi:hypothetical protein